MSLECSLNYLKTIDGFEFGAVINTDSKTVVTQTDAPVEMAAAAIGWSYCMMLQKELLEKMDIHDFVRSCLITAQRHHHALITVPYFDNVLLYAAFHRNVPYLFVQKAVDEAIDCMI